MSDQQHANFEAERFLRSHYSGVVEFDGTVLRRNYVIDGASGHLVIALHAGIEEAESIVMHVPDEGSDAIQLLVESSWLDAARDAACDRLLIYHRHAEAARFAALRITDAKKETEDLDASAILLKNDLAADEPRLCRLLNADIRKLGEVVERQAGRETIEPRAVGVDRFGLDIRTRTGLLRVDFDAQLSREQAIAMIESWTRSS